MAPSDVSLIDIYRSIIPFVLILLLGMVMLMVFPGIATWLPSQVYLRG
jgi:TRAP-type mannitol/chloroaromatic compound transport system permease large subunit